jgi:hypothetical protein
MSGFITSLTNGETIESFPIHVTCYTTGVQTIQLSLGDQILLEQQVIEVYENPLEMVCARLYVCMYGMCMFYVCMYMYICTYTTLSQWCAACRWGL